MLRTFNMGIGMTVVVSADDASKAVGALQQQGTEAQMIGEVVAIDAGDPRVIIEGDV